MMSFHSLTACICLALLLPFAAPAQAPQASLSIACDAECTWNVDGDQHGVLRKGQEEHLDVRLGTHRVAARSSDGKLWEETIDVTEPKQEQIRISFVPNSPPVEKGHINVPTGDKAVQTVNPTPEIPRFYAESRQIIVEAEVWDKTYKKGDRPWIGDEPLRPGEKDDVKHLLPIARGLKSNDFHVFENGVEQGINYFKEADFPAVDMTGQWYFVPTAGGTWGILQPYESYEPPSAIYLIGYVPPSIRSGECRTIKVVVEGRELQVNRDRYCASDSSGSLDKNTLEETKLGMQMRKFATSAARGSIRVSMQTFAFWSSGVLRLATEISPAGSTAALPATDYTYMVEVHGSRAPATVHISVGFDPPQSTWNYPCEKGEVLHVLGMVNKMHGEAVREFGDTLTCLTVTSRYLQQVWNSPTVLVPSRFDGQINLPPGEYDLHIVVSDGHNFGRARTSLRVQPFDAQRLMMSDVVVGGVLRGAGWVLREAADVSPSPVVPTPLVSKNLQFFPDTDTPPHLRKHAPLFLYFEIYEPWVESKRPAVYYRVRITTLKTGSLVMDTESMSAADWVLPGNAVIPIGLKIATDKLKKGSYRLEVQASDSVGRESEWRQATFTVE